MSLIRPTRNKNPNRSSTQCDCIAKAASRAERVLKVSNKNELGPYPSAIYICSDHSVQSQPTPQNGASWTDDDAVNLSKGGVVVSEEAAHDILKSLDACPGVRYCGRIVDGVAMADRNYGRSACSNPDCDACLWTGSRLMRCPARCGALKTPQGKCPNGCSIPARVARAQAASANSAGKHIGQKSRLERTPVDQGAIKSSRRFQKARLHEDLREVLSRIADRTGEPAAAVIPSFTKGGGEDVMVMFPFGGQPTRIAVGDDGLVQGASLPFESGQQDVQKPLRDMKARRTEALNFLAAVRGADAEGSGVSNPFDEPGALRRATDAYALVIGRALLDHRMLSWSDRRETRLVIGLSHPVTFPLCCQKFGSNATGAWHQGTEVRTMPPQLKPGHEWGTKEDFITACRSADEGERLWHDSLWPVPPQQMGDIPAPPDMQGDYHQGDKRGLDDDDGHLDKRSRR
eukprot:m.337974 g.337974  ORF g.337974 m.337974 type:complete len:459 (-) comp18283_c0_seq1:199-1575(-)